MMICSGHTHPVLLARAPRQIELKALTHEEVVAAVRDWLEQEEPGMITELKDLWSAMRTELTPSAVAEIITAGELPDDLEERWKELQEEWIKGPLRDRLIRGVAVAASVIAVMLGIDATNAGLASSMATWITERGQELLEHLVKMQRRSINGIVVLAVDTGLPTADAFTLARAVVGLTPGQARTLAAYRQALIDEDVPADQLERMIRERAREMRTVRGRRIARTELHESYSKAAHDAVLAAEDAGDIAGVWKTWLTAEDERVCPVCGPLGELPAQPLKEPYAVVVGKGIQAKQRTPAHISCRCAMVYEVRGEAEDVEDMELAA